MLNQHRRRKPPERAPVERSFLGENMEVFCPDPQTQRFHHEMACAPRRLQFDTLMDNTCDMNVTRLPPDTPFPPTPAKIYANRGRLPWHKGEVGTRKRKDTSPLAQEAKRAGPMPEGRALRSGGQVQVDLAPPNRPIEWKAYSSNATRNLNLEQSSSPEP